LQKSNNNQLALCITSNAQHLDCCGCNQAFG
jgi:hypothetical protein